MLITQLLAELYRCTDALEDAAALTAVVKRASGAVGATVIGEIEVRYVPHGLTIGLFLAESHIVLTTWPEHRLLLVDILLCNPEMDCHAVLDEIVHALCPAGDVVRHEVARRIADAA